MTQSGFKTEQAMSNNGAYIAMAVGSHTMLVHSRSAEKFPLLPTTGFMSFSSNSKYLVIASFRQPDQDMVYLFETEKGQKLAEFALDVTPSGVCVSDNLDVAVALGDGRLQVLTFDDATRELSLAQEKTFEGITSFLCKLSMSTNPLQVLVSAYSFLDEAGKECFGAQLLQPGAQGLEVAWQKNFHQSYPRLVYPLLQNQMGMDAETVFLLYGKDFSRIEKKMSIASHISSMSANGQYIVTLKEAKDSGGKKEFWAEVCNLKTKRRVRSEALVLETGSIGLDAVAGADDEGNLTIGIWGNLSDTPAWSRKYHVYIFDATLKPETQKVFEVTR